jgi:WD40 repeat protein
MPGVTGARGWSGKISKSWESGLREHVIALAVSPDSSLVAAAPSTGNAVVIDMQGGSPVASLPDQGDGTLCLGWDSSGRHLAAGGKDGSLLIFRDRDWANPVRVCPGGAWVESVACMPSPGMSRPHPEKGWPSGVKRGMPSPVSPIIPAR